MTVSRNGPGPSISSLQIPGFKVVMIENMCLIILFFPPHSHRPSLKKKILIRNVSSRQNAPFPLQIRQYPPPPPRTFLVKTSSVGLLLYSVCFYCKLFHVMHTYTGSGNEVDNAISGFPIMLSVSLPKWLLHRAS